jgi:hypothetical protein
MAPNLEKELASLVITEGSQNDKQYLQERIDALRDMGFKVDERAVQTELERYELVQRYNSQDNSRRAIKKIRREKLFQAACAKLDELKAKDPKIISGEALFEGVRNLTTCKHCKTDSAGSFYLVYIQFIEIAGILEKERVNYSQSYCLACNTYSDDTLTL